ncbi:MAG: NDP-sugar synthase [Acidimicrobiales bacterium]|nr:NDP-sugar synthase [Acidimicrobiales bacterium]
MQAVVLAGGLGTRLYPLTADTPKQMLPVVDRPMIEHVVAHLGGHGVTRVVLSLAFRPEAFIDAYPDGTCAGIPIHYSVEPEPLDTAGAVRFAAVDAGIAETFLVLNGDVLTDLDVSVMVDGHRTAGAMGTIALTEVDNPARYGVVDLVPDWEQGQPADQEFAGEPAREPVAGAAGLVRGFVEKPSPDAAPSRWVNAGTYVLEPSILDRIEVGRRVSIEREVFPSLVLEGSLRALCSASYWLDAGTPEAYLRAQFDLIDGTRAWMDPVSSTAVVAADAEVERSVLLPGASVAPGARVCDAVLMEGAVVEAGATVRDSVLGPGARVGERAVVTGLSLIGRAAVAPRDAKFNGVRLPDGQFDERFSGEG